MLNLSSDFLIKNLGYILFLIFIICILVSIKDIICVIFDFMRYIIMLPFKIINFLFGPFNWDKNEQVDIKKVNKKVEDYKDKIGKKFEERVKRIVSNSIYCKDVLSGLLIENGLTKEGRKRKTEVDIIAFTEKCLIVIETKHFSGNIKGNIDDRKLMFESENGGSREGQNPIKQNNGHINFIKRIIGKKIPIVSLIVFSNKANISTLNGNERDIFICKKNSLEEKIEKILTQNNKEIDISVLDKAYEKLSKSNDRVTEQDKKEHLKYA